MPPPPMRAKDKCPSCFQPVAPTDFLCPNCELILDPSQAPERPVGEVSVVRRMLERPQRGVPSAKLDVKAEVRAATKARSSTEGLEGPTRRLDLGPELAGVPVVVASLSSKKSEALTELEAWLVSLIDGLSDAEALAKKAGVREFELRVMLRTLNEKHIIDFADEPLSDEDLNLPSVVMGTMDASPAGDEPDVTAPMPAGAIAAAAAASYGANVDRRDGRFAVPPAPARSSSADDWSSVMPADEPPPPPPPRAPPTSPAKGTVAARGGAPFVPAFPSARGSQPPSSLPPELLEDQDPPIVTGRAEPPVLTPASKPAKPVSRHDLNPEVPYPGKGGVVTPARPRASVPPPPPLPTPPPAPAAASKPGGPIPSAELGVVRSSDARIAYAAGKANQKVLDALKQVKRNDGKSAPVREEEKQQPLADVLARDSLQVALRMEQNGRMDEAIRFLEKSIAQSPDAASLYNRLGIILMRERGDYRRAEQMIRKATELVPDNTVYATNLKQVLSRHAMKSHR